MRSLARAFPKHNEPRTLPCPEDAGLSHADFFSLGGLILATFGDLQAVRAWNMGVIRLF